VWYSLFLHIEQKKNHILKHVKRHLSNNMITWNSSCGAKQMCVLVIFHFPTLMKEKNRKKKRTAYNCIKTIEIKKNIFKRPLVGSAPSDPHLYALQLELSSFNILHVCWFHIVCVHVCVYQCVNAYICGTLHKGWTSILYSTPLSKFDVYTRVSKIKLG